MRAHSRVSIELMTSGLSTSLRQASQEASAISA